MAENISEFTSNLTYIRNVQDRMYIRISSVTDKNYIVSSLTDKNNAISYVTDKSNIILTVTDNNNTISSVTDKNNLITGITDNNNICHFYLNISDGHVITHYHIIQSIRH